MIERITTPSLRLRQSILLYARMARPAQLLAVILVYGWGILIALSEKPGLSIVTVAAGLLPLLLISASIHYANEYRDVQTDALTVRTPFSGGSGSLSDYGAPPRIALRAASLTLITGFVVAVAATGMLF